MAQMASTRSGAKSSSWAVGFGVFAACMLIMIGAWHVIAGLAAIFENEFFVVSPNYLFELDVTAWGWVHVIGGAAVLAAGFGLFNGAVWARTIGVIVAIVSGIVNFVWLPYYPVWSALMIALDVAVIWALTAHGRDLEETS